MERGKGTLSAVQEVKENFGIPVIAVATLEDLIGYLADSPELAANLDAVKAYREQYGISARWIQACCIGLRARARCAARGGAGTHGWLP